MPFVVTTKRPVDAVDCGHPDAPRDGWPVSRRAVATLEEARAIMRAAQNSAPEDLIVPFSVTESGGSVGPLPDGTVIEVEPTTYVHLACDGDWQWPQDDTDYSSPARHGAEVIAAYNARGEF